MCGNYHPTPRRTASDKKTLTVTLLVSAALAEAVWGQTIPVTPEPVGSGARALGQSAFIAVADDATAASWNPAGLINLERPEASFVGAWRTTARDYSRVGGGASIDPDSWSASEINFMSYALPLRMSNTDAVVSVNYHQVYDLGLEYHSLLPIESLGAQKDWGQSEGAISAYSLAGGLSIPGHPEITFGAGFNWFSKSLGQDWAWQVTTRTSIVDPNGKLILGPTTTTETFDDFGGYNFTFGFLWDVYERQENLLTLGIVCHTPFTAEAVRNEKSDSLSFPSQRMEISYPLSLGAGANYRISDSLSVALDVQWTDWSEFEQKNLSTHESTSPIKNDTTAVRLGTEHLTFLGSDRQSVLACRGGIFYEPRPAPEEPLPVYGFSLGLGWTLKDQFSLDFAYQFRWGMGEGSLAETAPFDYDFEEHFFVISFIRYFGRARATRGDVGG